MISHRAVDKIAVFPEEIKFVYGWLGSSPILSIGDMSSVPKYLAGRRVNFKTALDLANSDERMEVWVSFIWGLYWIHWTGSGLVSYLNTSVSGIVEPIKYFHSHLKGVRMDDKPVSDMTDDEILLEISALRDRRSKARERVINRVVKIPGEKAPKMPRKSRVESLEVDGLDIDLEFDEETT